MPNFPKIEVTDGIHMFVQAKPKRRWRRLWGLSLIPYWTGTLVAVEINTDVQELPKGSSGVPSWCDLLAPENARVRVADASLRQGKDKIMAKSVYLDIPGEWRYVLTTNTGHRDENAPIGDFTVFSKDSIVWHVGLALVTLLVAIAGSVAIEIFLVPDR